MLEDHVKNLVRGLLTSEYGPNSSLVHVQILQDVCPEPYLFDEPLGI
jgi:hypothetical protein